MRKTWITLAVGALLVPLTLAAQELSWRSTSVQGPRTPTLNTRVGVAIFGASDTATYERRVRPAGPPQAGKLPIDVEMVFRFADGATLQMRSRETINLTAQGTHGRDEWTGDGQIVGGSGRFQGATGTYTFRALMGLDGQADGMVGDAFLSGQGRYTLQAAQ